MTNIFKNLNCLNKFDKILWLISVVVITLTFAISDNFYPPTLIVSVIGVSSLIFAAKGHVFGQALMIVFSLLYGFISLRFAYYGELITYVGMTAPMAFLAMVSWLKNPFVKGKNEVAVAKITKKNIISIIICTIFVTSFFHLLLAFLNTANLFLSTLSITTSFIAAYLTYLRSEWYAVAYAANDFILILLWLLASFEDNSYYTMVICFLMFFINDLYGFVSWRSMKRKQLSSL